MTNGPRDPAPEDREEEDDGYDFPTSLPLPPARRTLSEMGGSLSSSSSSSSSSGVSSTAAFNRLSLDVDAGAVPCRFAFLNYEQILVI